MKHSKLLAVALSTVLLAACGGGESGSSVLATEVFNKMETLAEGSLQSISLSPGTYQAIISSSTNGVKVEWVGGTSCTTSAETKTYNNICKMGQSGQLVITNPTVFGLGASEIVTIKVLLNP
jgi:hypothetical protein